MEVEFTRHAKNRMRWRKISAESVKETMKSPEKVERLPDGKLNYIRRHGDHMLYVTVAKEMDKTVVITTIWKKL